MNCQKIKRNFVDFLTGEIEDDVKESIQSHLAGCDSCRAEMENLNEMWTKLGVLPEVEPSETLRPRFYTMLETYKATIESESPAVAAPSLFTRFFQSFSLQKPAFQMTAVLAVLAVGLLGGFLISTSGHRQQTIVTMQQEMENMRTMMAVSLMGKQSPNERLMGVQWASRIQKPAAEVTGMLIRTLNEDASVNVRLAALDTLYAYRKDDRVRASLVSSLKTQRSPLVQVAIMDFLVSVGEKEALPALKQLSEEQDLDEEVKQHARSSANQLKI